MRRLHHVINENPTWFSAERTPWHWPYLQNASVKLQSWALQKTEHDTWEQIEQLQLRRIQKLVKHAYTTTTFWKEHMDKVHMAPEDIHTLEDFKKIPPVQKRDLRAVLLPERTCVPIPRSRSQYIVTSGTTGTAIEIALDTWITERYVAARERGTRWILGPKKQGDLGVRIGIRNTFYPGYKVFEIDDFHEAQDIEEQLYQLSKKFNCVVSANPSTAFELASLARKNNHNFCLKGLFLSGEDMLPGTAELLKETFHCPVVKRYTCSESGSLAHQCLGGNFHVNPDQQFVEILEDNKNEVVPGDKSVGSILLTDLNNLKMPTIRYDFGDLGTLLPSSYCTCSIPFPVIKFYGRESLSFLLPSGKRVFSTVVFQPLMKPNPCPWITQFQVVRTKPDLFTISLVSREKEVTSGIKELKKMLEKNLDGECHVHITVVPTLANEKGRKNKSFVLNP